jgi:ribonuclease HI
MIVEVSFDGGCVNNPNGPASSAAIVRDREGHTLRHVGLPIGIASNNVAEWRALQLGLETAHDLGAAGVHAYGDSKLVVEQFAGRFAIHEERLKAIALEVSRLARRFPEGVKVTWVPREANRAADAICSAVLGGSYVPDAAIDDATTGVADVEVSFICTVRMDPAKVRAALAGGGTPVALRKQLAARAETRLLLASQIGDFRISPSRVKG